MVGMAAVALLSVGCDGDDGETTQPPPLNCEDGLCLQEPASGFQIRTDGTEIESGQDVEYCEVVQLPGDADDVYYVNRFEVAMSEGSHHLIVSAAELGTATEAAMTLGDRVPCTGGDVYGGELVPVTGSQQPTNEQLFPAGVGRVYYGGQKLVFDYHYFNTTAEPISARAAVNFHTVPKEDVTNLAQAFGFINLGISVPPGQSADFTQQCTFSREVTVFGLTRHTHKWGRDFDVWYVGGPNDGEHIFKSADYEDINHTFAEPVVIKAGEGFRFRCAYDNTEDYTLEFGLKATDEMCILFGSWFAPDIGHEVVQQGCIGTGE